MNRRDLVLWVGVTWIDVSEAQKGGFCWWGCVLILGSVLMFFLLCVVRAMCTSICLRCFFRCGKTLFGWTRMYSGYGGVTMTFDVSCETWVTSHGLEVILTLTHSHTLFCVRRQWCHRECTHWLKHRLKKVYTCRYTTLSQPTLHTHTRICTHSMPSPWGKVSLGLDSWTTWQRAAATELCHVHKDPLQSWTGNSSLMQPDRNTLTHTQSSTTKHYWQPNDITVVYTALSAH